MNTSAEKISQLCGLMEFDLKLTQVALEMHADKSPQEIQSMIDQVREFREKATEKLPDLKLM